MKQKFSGETLEQHLNGQLINIAREQKQLEKIKQEFELGTIGINS